MPASRVPAAASRMLVASKKISQEGESFEEILDRAVISTKKTEKSNVKKAPFGAKNI